MNKPLIGILPLIDTEKDSYWMLPGYMLGIEYAGGIPVMLPLTTDKESLHQLAKTFDGFLFTGGHDISPSLYGAKKSPFCGECSRERDWMEQQLLEFILQLDKPILGICRGIQLLNVVLGGTLYQDLPTEHPSSIEHHQQPPYDIPVHTVKLEKNSPLYELLKKDDLSVNSYHHQAVKELSPKLKAMAYSPDGLIEAVWMPQTQFVWAVQWHPEFCYRTHHISQQIFEKFLAHTKNKLT